MGQSAPSSYEAHHQLPHILDHKLTLQSLLVKSPIKAPALASILPTAIFLLVGPKDYFTTVLAAEHERLAYPGEGGNV